MSTNERVMEAVLINAQTTKASMFFKPADSAVSTLSLALGCAQLFDHPGGASSFTNN